MKDSEFIELLNLYLDHEISASDAARLEAAVQSNPERQRVYRQYCKMQKACKVLAADFATASDGNETAHEKKVVAFNPHVTPRPARNARYVFGSLAAAAACVALVFVGRNRTTPDLDATRVAEPVAQVSASEAKPVVTEAPPAVPRGLISVAQRQDSTLVSNPLLLTGNSQAQAMRAAAARQADNQLAWLEAVQLAPLPERTPDNGELLFSSRLVSEGRALGNRAASSRLPETGEEMVTFRFIK
jgi:hypothetical protein